MEQESKYGERIEQKQTELFAAIGRYVTAYHLVEHLLPELFILAIGLEAKAGESLFEFAKRLEDKLSMISIAVGMQDACVQELWMDLGKRIKIANETRNIVAHSYTMLSVTEGSQIKASFIPEGSSLHHVFETKKATNSSIHSLSTEELSSNYKRINEIYAHLHILKRYFIDGKFPDYAKSAWNHKAFGH